MTSNTRDSRQSGVRLPLWGLGLVLVVVLALLGISGYWLFNRVQTLASEWEVTDAPEFTETSSNTAVVENEPVIIEPNGESDTPIETAPQIQTWEGRERVTILIMGVDQRCGETGPTRTDTLMLLTVDPIGKTAGILSLPRDLWVEIPGFGVDRINQAHYFGEGFEYPGGGPALAEETVEATLGIEINYYATVNFDVFIETVNLLGGIEVEVEETIDDPKYPDNCYGFDPFRIEAGRHLLYGEEALKFARTRATEGGDVDRAARQQQVILAVRDRLFDQIPELLIQAPLLWQTMQSNIRTTMTLDEAIQLALLVQEIPRENIQRAVIDYNYVYTEKTPDGQDVLVPIRENIRALRDELFAPAKIPTAVIVDLPEKMQAEEARIAIYNGTPVFGLAGETRDFLIPYEFTITEVGNADAATYPSTQIIDFGDHPFTTQYLVQLMDIPPLNISTGSKPDGDYDLLIIIGNDWEVPGE